MVLQNLFSWISLILFSIFLCCNVWCYSVDMCSRKGNGKWTNFQDVDELLLWLDVTTLKIWLHLCASLLAVKIYAWLIILYQLLNCNQNSTLKQLLWWSDVNKYNRWLSLSASLLYLMIYIWCLSCINYDSEWISFIAKFLYAERGNKQTLCLHS